MNRIRISRPSTEVHRDHHATDFSPRGVRPGFTLIELLIVIAIIAILAAILFPVFARARENARRSSCASNMKQIGLGIMQYTQDYDEYYPHQQVHTQATFATSTMASWAKGIEPYIKGISLLACPSAMPSTSSAPVGESRSSYMASGVIVRGPGDDNQLYGRVLNVAAVLKPSELIMAHELVVTTNSSQIRPYYEFGSPGNNDGFRHWMHNTSINKSHFEGGNLLYVDGHVKFKMRESICARDFGLNFDSCGQHDPAIIGRKIDTSILTR